MKKTIQNPYFWLGFLIKIIFLFFGGAEIFHKLFIPFLDMAVHHWGQNPWSFFPPNYFPYGLPQLLFFTLPKTLFSVVFGDLAFGETWLSYFSIKVVLLGFDTALFFVLKRFAVSNEKRILWYYWLNPVLFYISYIHGQLDVVPMYFSILSLLYLVKKDLTKFSIFAAIATLCKFHTLAIMPFAMAYLWNTNFRADGIKKIARSLSLYAIILILGFWPQLMAGNLSSVGVGSPEALSIFGMQLKLDSDRIIFLGFLLIVATVARLCISTRITPDGLVFGSGVIFGALLLGSAPGAGWYFWFLPFVCIFYATRSFKFHSILLGFYVLYLAHFVLRDFFPVENLHLFSSVTFSLLQFSVLCLMVSIWISVLKFETPLLRRVRPLMIGLAGNSGSGKNTATEVIQDLFGSRDASVVEGDDYHKWERGNQRWQDYTHLNPKANFLENMAVHTRALRAGKLIYQAHYDHSTGRFTEPRAMETSKNLIVQGLHTFYLESLRQLFDIKIFMAPEERLRTAWKVRRDVNERGHAMEKVLQSLKAREEDSNEHIYPQKKWADWIIESKILASSVAEEVNPNFYVRHIVWNDTPLAPLVESLEEIARVKTEIEIYSENINQIAVTFHGDPSQDQIRAVAERTYPYLRHLIRSYKNPIWRSGKDGLFQLLLLALIERQNFMREVI